MIESSDNKTDKRCDALTDPDGEAAPGQRFRPGPPTRAFTGLRTARGHGVMAHPLTRRLIWILFAIVFYQSGLVFTTWLLEPEYFTGGLDWAWLLAFPVLLPGFFVVNRQLGCASGQCPTRQRANEPEVDESSVPYPDRMPGV